ncbi:hypothetical protein CRM22_006028 [Opisthorchis felineus]|uniref:BHLH domain-containing protein n=1 Tax=Opisthorchis felineus TaxID=147828 RepID=A0A4S2LVK1_OPIFE|nr:hypothetical protein CRM22_006028 [Opisthorchis felineus]
MDELFIGLAHGFKPADSGQGVKMTRPKPSASGRSPRARKILPHGKMATPLVEMRKCLGQLKRMVPTIEQHQKINQLELLQHVINYIQDLEVTLDCPGTTLKAVSPFREVTDSGKFVQTRDSIAS